MITAFDLYNKLHPIKQDVASAQLLSDGLNANMSSIFSKLIKDAARCNDYNSDIYYDLQIIDDARKNFNPNEEFEPIWIGFRKLGVDCTSFVLSRVNQESFYGSLSSNYFALYCLTVEKIDEGFYNIILNQYAV